MIWAALLKWITGDLVGQLTKAYEARLRAQNETEKLIADVAVKDIEARIEANRLSASVVKEGMQHKVFWIPWLIAAIPTSLWFAWGMLDSLFNGALPDVAALPPQLKQYADVVFANIFFVGGGVKGIELIASAIRGRNAR
jgi:hypothetical protein